MSKVSKKELKVIGDKFKGLSNFLMFYADLLQMQEEQAGIAPVELDSTSYTSEGTITGIIMAAEAKRKSIIVEMIVDGCRRKFKLDKVYSKKLFDIEKEMLAARKKDETEQIEAFEFLKYKPFLLDVQDSVVIELTPLDWNLYEKYYPAFKQLMAS